MGMGMEGWGWGRAQQTPHRAEGAVPVFAELHKGCSFPKITPVLPCQGFSSTSVPFHSVSCPLPGLLASARAGRGPGGCAVPIPGCCQALCSSRGGMAVPSLSVLQGLQRVPKEVSHSPGLVSPTGMSSDMRGLFWGQRWGVLGCHRVLVGH